MSTSQIPTPHAKLWDAISLGLFIALSTLAVLASLVIGGRAWYDGTSSCPNAPTYASALAIFGSGIFTLSAAMLFPRVRANAIPKITWYVAYPASSLSFLLFLLMILIVTWNLTGGMGSLLYGRMAGRRFVAEDGKLQLSWEWQAEEAAPEKYFDTPWAAVPVWHGAWIRDARDKLKDQRREVADLFYSSAEDRELARQANAYLAALDRYARLSSLFIIAALAGFAGVIGWLCNRELWVAASGAGRADPLECAKQ